MPQFDPTAKFGTVHGNGSQYPTARFTQGGYIFDSLHRCLNPPEKEDATGKIPPPPMSDEDTEKLIKLKSNLEKASERLKKADQEFRISGTTGKKSNLTKAKKAYDKATAEMDAFIGDTGIKDA